MASLRRVTRSLPAVLSAATTLVAQERSPAADPHAGALGSSSPLRRPWSTADLRLLDLVHPRSSSPSGPPHATGEDLVFLPSSHKESVIWLALDRSASSAGLPHVTCEELIFLPSSAISLALDRSASFGAPKNKEEEGSTDDLGEGSGESLGSGSSGGSSDSSDSDDEDSDSSDSSDTDDDDDENVTHKAQVVRQLFQLDSKDLLDRRKAYLKEFKSRRKSHEQEARRAAIHRNMIELSAAARSHAEKDTKGVADLGKKVFNYPGRTLGTMVKITNGLVLWFAFVLFVPVAVLQREKFYKSSVDRLKEFIERKKQEAHELVHGPQPVPHDCCAKCTNNLPTHCPQCGHAIPAKKGAAQDTDARTQTQGPDSK